MPTTALFSIVLFASTLAGAAPAAPPERIRFVTASHLPQPTRLETVHAATCGSVDYRLVVSPGRKSVILSGSGLPDTDLSTTTLGARLLEDDILVDVGFNCPVNALNIFIKGVKLVDLGAPVGFRDHVSVGIDGKVSQGSPRAEHLGEMARPREGVTSQPARLPAD